MGIFGRIFSDPDWKTIEKLPEDRKLDCLLVILASGGIPAILMENLIDPALDMIHRLGYTAELSVEAKNYLVQEASIAVLKSTAIPTQPPKSLRTLSWKQFHRLATGLTFVEIASQRNEMPVTLEEVEYSSEALDAETQYLVVLSRNIGVTDTTMIYRLRFAGFDDLWGAATTVLLSGLETGFSRQPAAALQSRGKQEYRALSAMGKGFVKEMVNRYFLS